MLLPSEVPVVLCKLKLGLAHEDVFSDGEDLEAGSLGLCYDLHGVR